MDISVIIVSFNVRYFLEQCLDSVRKSAQHIDHEIFVVDNNSRDDTCSMISREFPEVRLIANNENRGFSAANNQALILATGRYILILNPDTVVGEETFDKCINFMDLHPDAGATGVMMINGKGRLLPESKRALPTPGTAFFKIAGFSYIFPRSGLFSKYYLGNLNSLSTSQVDIISGAFMFLRRTAVIKTGLFDEAFFMYGEDIDYSYRLLKRGFVNFYYPETKIIHFKGESTKKENLNVLVSFYKAMIIFVRKHFSNGNSKVLIVPIQAAIFFRAGLSFLKQFVRRMSLLFSFNLFAGTRKTVIVSDSDGYDWITEMLASAGLRNRIAGRVSINREHLNESTLGDIGQIREIISSGKIREVIFILGKLSTSQIIDCMHFISDLNISVKIASEERKFMIGSGYVNIF
jgi:GT2 family glycosyltransferase